MRKFLIAAAASLLLLGGQAQAAPVEKADNQLEIQEQGKWAHFRDKHLLGRETENERRDRKDWERRHRHDPPPPGYRGYGPPPPGHRGYGPPPPGHRGYGPPPPRR